MNLPRLEIKKIGIIIAIVAALAVIGYKTYQLHYDNLVWCLTHSRPCDISRLENTRDELIKVKELDQVKEVLDK